MFKNFSILFFYAVFVFFANNSFAKCELGTKEREESAKLLGEGIELQKAEKHLEAIEIFNRAYSICPHPKIIYYRAISLISIKKYEGALKDLISIRDNNEVLKYVDKIENKIKEIEEILKKLKAKEIIVEKKEVKPVVKPQVVEKKKEKKDSTWAWVTLGGGIALTGLGTAMLIRYGVDLSNAEGETDKHYADSVSKTNLILGSISTSAGIGLIVTSIFLFPPKEEKKTSGFNRGIMPDIYINSDSFLINLVGNF